MEHYVCITAEDGGIIDIELNEEVAPITCENFTAGRSGFYNGLDLHRVIPGFMIQRGPAVTAPAASAEHHGELTAGVNNPLKHTRGVISMARKDEPQQQRGRTKFFIMHQDAPI